MLRRLGGGSERRMRNGERVPSCAQTWNAARLAVVAARKASERTSEQASKQAGRDCPPVSPTPSMPRRAHGLRIHGGEWGSPSRSSRHPLRERRRVSTRRGAIILTSQDGGGHGGPVRAHARQGRQDPRDRRVRATGHHRRVLRSRCQVLPGRLARRHQEVSVPATRALIVPPELFFLPFSISLSFFLFIAYFPFFLSSCAFILYDDSFIWISESAPVLIIHTNRYCIVVRICFDRSSVEGSH